MLHDNITVKDGHLYFAGADTVALAGEYGTPLYLLDEDMVRSVCAVYRDSMAKYFGGGSAPLYASKALAFREMYRIAGSEGLNVDVVSSGELYTALSAGFPPEKIYFHGSCKTDADIRYAVASGIGHFVVDSFEELGRVDELAGEAGIEQPVLLRVTPGIDPHTFKAVSTGQVDSKFGTPIETGRAEVLVKTALGCKNVVVDGLHCHIGSQIFDIKPFCDTCDIMFAFISLLKEKYGFDCRVLDLGGGFGVRYIDSDPVMDYAAAIKKLAGCVSDRAKRAGVTLPVILLEPGRSIVAAAGMTLYKVGSVKRIEGYKNYVAIDGGMTDDPRYALYGSKYTVYTANRMDEPADLVCTLGGCCCESGDMIGEGLRIASPVRGDIIAVAVTGAYNYSMASNYNRIPRPALVILKGGTPRLGVRRETFADLTRCDM